jgi:hypothetical protein
MARHPTTATAHPTRRQRFRAWRRRWWCAISWLCSRFPGRVWVRPWLFAVEHIMRLDAHDRRDRDWARASGHDAWRQHPRGFRYCTNAAGDLFILPTAHDPDHAPTDEHHHAYERYVHVINGARCHFHNLVAHDGDDW